ncbi:MAG: DUF4870 domain-containing protein [Chloroflexota bacterium]
MPETRFSEESEDRLVAAFCHLGAFLPFFGMLAALIIWLTQKARSRWLGFQALQALLFQGIALALYYLVGLGMSAAYFVFIIPLITLNETGWGDRVPYLLVPFIFLFLGMLLLIVLAAFVYYLLAALAAINTLRGKEYRYPLIGTWVESLTSRR